jgi:secondary thiamine-phosphate synthase enzyme
VAKRLRRSWALPIEAAIGIESSDNEQFPIIRGFESLRRLSQHFMMQSSFVIETTDEQQVIEITQSVQDCLKGSFNGACLVYVPHATASIIINENADPNVGKDILQGLEKNIPARNNWLHDKIDGNAHSHIKASILGPSEMIPVKNGKLQLGRWQGILLCEFDGPRTRKMIVQTLKEDGKL